MQANRSITFCELSTAQPNIAESVISEFNNKIEESCEQIIVIGGAVETFKNNFQNNVQRSKECAQQIVGLQNAIRTNENEQQIDALVTEANQIWLRILQEGHPILESIRIVVNSLGEAQRILVDKLLRAWKHDQILAGYGYADTGITVNVQDTHLKNALDLIQQQFEELLECVLNTRTLLDVIRGCYSQASYVDSVEKEATRVITIILQKLIYSCLVVDEQPPQFIKKDTR